MFLQHIGLVAAEEDHVRDAVGTQPLKLMLDDRPPRDRHHVLRTVVGQRPQSLAFTARDDQRKH
jgi:hypothetical protein